MGIFGSTSTRNHGWGKRMEWAGVQALRSHYALGSFSTLSTRIHHWRMFCQWAQSHGLRDARSVTVEVTLDYARHLQSSGCSVPYGQNLLSSLNCTMRAMGSRTYVSPSRAFGAKRIRIRSEPPSYLDMADLTRATGALLEANLPRVAALLMLARHAGLRLGEASLANLKTWEKQANRYGKINVQRGTKGGRRAPRWIDVSPALKEAIQFAASVAQSNCLLAPNESLIRWYRTEVQRGRRLLHRLQAGKIHDCRTAFACQRYRQLTGYPAPVVAGVRLATRAEDARARDQIAYELGHGRRDVVASYCGSSRQ